jgi:phosphoadenosine phosphosulfate reductase
MTTLLDKIEYSKNLIKEAVEKYPRIAVAVSWGKDSMVILHLARQIKPDIAVFTVVTPFKPKETLEFKDRIIKEWNLNIKEYQSKAKIIPGLWETNPDECCHIFKVEPTKEAVKDLDAWIAGLRKSEGRTRVDYKEIEKRGNLVKINPILEWSELDIWRYSALYGVPQNPLYKRGFRSLGCAPCTKIVDENETERAGRWQGTSKCGGECGIHTKTLK